MQMNYEYLVITGLNFLRFQNDVTYHLNQGWKLSGGIFINGCDYYQSLVIESPIDTNKLNKTYEKKHYD